jgi:DNA-binding transcriptional regulator YiaG
MEVARSIGIDVMTVNNWETGRRNPAVRLIPSLLKVLGYSPFAKAHSITEKLKTHRYSLGLSQKALASLLVVDPSTVKIWESGLREPRGKWLRKVMRYLDEVK